MLDYITAENAKILAEAGSIRSVIAEPDGAAFVLRLRIGMSDRLLRPAHGRPRPRRFRRLESVAKFARQDLGMSGIEVSLADWDPPQRTAAA